MGTSSLDPKEHIYVSDNTGGAWAVLRYRAQRSHQLASLMMLCHLEVEPLPLSHRVFPPEHEVSSVLHVYGGHVPLQ